MNKRAENKQTPPPKQLPNSFGMNLRYEFDLCGSDCQFFPSVLLVKLWLKCIFCAVCDNVVGSLPVNEMSQDFPGLDFVVVVNFTPQDKESDWV